MLDAHVPCWVNTLATVVQLLASACNPLIYGIFRKEYRKAFKIQYLKVCHRMQARFTSSEFSDSFTYPSSDHKQSTLKRKEHTKQVVQAMNSRTEYHNGDGRCHSTDQLYPSLNKESSRLESNSRSAVYRVEEPDIGPVVEEPQKKYSLPQRAVSFNDSPDLVNQTTEIVAL